MNEYGDPRSKHDTCLEPHILILASHSCVVDSDDCWLLGVSRGIGWTEFVLPYDHGEPRCCHAACYLEPDLILHSGLTQPFYNTRLQLNVNNAYG